MTVKLEAYQTITYLPNPRFGDSESLVVSVNTKIALDSTRRTYVTNTGRRKLILEFKLGSQKALELREFIKSYYSSNITLTDHNNIMWIGNFTVNPFDFIAEINEWQNIQIEFEGVKQ